MTHTLSHSSGFYKVERRGKIWITQPADVLEDVPVKYEVLEDHRLSAPPSAKVRRIKTKKPNKPKL